jgi:hypothetical protein
VDRFSVDLMDQGTIRSLVHVDMSVYNVKAIQIGKKPFNFSVPFGVTTNMSSV